MKMFKNFTIELECFRLKKTAHYVRLRKPEVKLKGFWISE